MFTTEEIKTLLQRHKLLVIKTGARNTGDAANILTQALNELTKQKETSNVKSQPASTPESQSGRPSEGDRNDRG